MPRRLASGSDVFNFDVAAPTVRSYAPGDTIIGNLVRRTSINTHSATVSLTFEGRSKVKIVRKNNQSTRRYRDDWKILKVKEFIIYEGPLHLPEGSEETLTWPIALKIPLEPMQSCSAGYDMKGSYFPKDMSHPLHHTLPGSFNRTDISVLGGTESTDFVEYFLTAYLRYENEGRQKVHEALHPITIRHSVIKDNRFGAPHMLMSPQSMVSSQRLLPGMEKADLSLRQHTQKLFRSSKVPQLFYKLLFTAPASIQLGNPTPLPLQLEIVPDQKKTSDSIKDMVQNFQIQELRAHLICATTDRSTDTFLGNVESNYYTEKIHLNLQQVLIQLETPPVITTGTESGSIHLGNMLQLTLDSRGLRSGTRLPGPSYGLLVPDLTTHNIRHTHYIDWKIILNIAGETETHRFQHSVQIIAPA